MSTHCEVLFGGTFDPIHNGHLACAQKALDFCQADKLWFIPNSQPPHRQKAQASNQQRIDMIELAISRLPTPHYAVSDIEMQRDGASYTVDTLAEWRQQHPSDQLYFLIGADSLRSIHSWHRWQDLLNYCHLLVAARPNHPFDGLAPEVESWLKENEFANGTAKNLLGNVILLADCDFDISATEIRQSIEQRSQADKQWQTNIPTSVADYIIEHGLYTAGSTK